MPTDVNPSNDGKPKDLSKIPRLKPRVFPYQEALPYKTESKEDTLAHLNHIITNLYIILKSLDKDYEIDSTVASGVLHWTRELNSWMQLKFDMPLDLRAKLAKFYYELALSDIDGSTLEKVANTFIWLCDDDTFLRKVSPSDLNLRVKPLVKILKDKLISPDHSALKIHLAKSYQTLCRLSCTARSFFHYEETEYIFQEILPLVSFFFFYSFCFFSFSLNSNSLQIL